MITFMERLPLASMLAALNISLGLALILGADTRTTSPSFATAKTIAPIHLWGLSFLAVGLIGLNVRHIRAAMLTLTAGSSLYAFWTIAFILTALNDKRAAITGIVVYTWVAAVHTIAAIKIASHRVEG